jgi:uncharacterized protein DUF3987
MTIPTDDPAEAFRAAVQSLLDGNAPNGVLPAHVGGYGQQLEQFHDAHASGGTPAVKRLAATLARNDKGIAQILASNAPEKPIKRRGCPVLPHEAMQVYAQAAPCAQWLDDYITFALQAAPMGPRSFHEIAGLFAVSVAIARRLKLSVSIGDIYPNLFALWIGDPAIYSKTSAMRALTRLLNDAGLKHLLLPERLTPEAMMLQYSLSIPPTLDQWQPEAKEQWIKEKAYAARRGWVMDEAARLFNSLKVDYNAGLLGLLLQLYDCPDEKSEETTGRGRIIVSDTYLSFFGVATPYGMAEHFTNRTLWETGLWSRFALMMPDSVPPWQFLGDHIPMPGALLRRFREIFDLFPPRAAQLIESDDSKKRYIHLMGTSDPTPAILGPGVRAAWEAYAKATRYDLLLTGHIDKALYGSYGRFGTQAVKVAMLLATMDTEEIPVKVEVRHWVRAQQIVEGWRAGLHRIWTEGVQTDEERDTDRILARLSEAGQKGLLARDIYRSLTLKSSDANVMLGELEHAGQVEKVPGVNANNRAVIYWRLVVPPSNTKPEVSSVNTV